MIDMRIFRRLAIGSIVLLAIPLLGTLMTDQFDWNIMDFVIMGSMLFGFNVTVSLVYKNIDDRTIRLIAVAVAIVVLILFWMELAVGIFNSPFSGS